MEKEKNVLVLDIGSSSIRLAVLDAKANCIWLSSRDYQNLTIDGANFEYDAEEWFLLFDELMQEGKLWVEDFASIGALVVTAQRSTLIPVDEKGKSIRKAIGWQDLRHRRLCDDLAKLIDDLQGINGAKMNYAYLGPKILWLKQNEKANFDKAFQFFNPQQFITYRLTASTATDPTYASRTHLFDIHTGKWSEELLNIMGVPVYKLGEIVETGSQLGKMQKQWTDKWGLAEDLPVYTAGGDQQCTALSLGVIRKGSVQLKADKGAYVATLLDRSDYRLEYFDCNASAIPGFYNYESGIRVCDRGFRYLANTFFPGQPDHVLEKALEDSPIASNGLRVKLLDPKKSVDVENILDLCNFNQNVTKNDILHACLESIAVNLLLRIENVESVLKSPADRILLEGKLADFKKFQEILSVILTGKIYKPTKFETAIYGAWVNFAVTSSMYATYEDALEAVHEQIHAEALGKQDKQYSKYRQMVLDYRNLITNA